MEKIISMEQHIKQLNCILKKQIQNPSADVGKKKRRELIFSDYKLRHVFLKFLYLGWNYKGFVVQEDYLETVENSLFDALLKTKLIESRETCNYHRCGRTDKGVSAFCQVISLTLRSRIKKNPEEEANQDSFTTGKCPSPKNWNLRFLLDLDEELDYVAVLNGVLPNDIRVFAWAPIAANTISARFDCQRRVYHYYFPRGQFHTDSMNEACKYLIGEHDFRNLCKMDVNNGVVNYIRHVFDAGVRCEATTSDPYSICVFYIEASAFLWHQIRCIMAVLLLVGQGFEQPTIISKLLNLEECPSKPQYAIASDFPLVLYNAQYDPTQVPKWIYGKNESVLKDVIGKLHENWIDNAVRSAILKSMIDSLNSIFCDQYETCKPQFVPKLMNQRTKTYRSLLERPFGESLESKIIKCASKKQIKLQ